MIEQLFGKFVNVYCYTVYTVCLTKKTGINLGRTLISAVCHIKITLY